MKELNILEIATDLTAVLIKQFELESSNKISQDLRNVYVTVALSMKFLNFRFCSQNKQFSKRQYKEMVSTIQKTFQLLAKEGGNGAAK